MSPDQIFIIVDSYRVSLAKFAKMKSYTTVYASGCTGLTELSAPKAEYVDASGCTGLTELSAPEAKTVYARGCTGIPQYDCIDGPKESRGYEFYAIHLRGSWWYCAGCRFFTLEQARKHWSPNGAGGDGSKTRRAECLAAVELLAAEVAKR